MTFPWQLDDDPHEECGVFGIYAPDTEVARVTFFALYALQHRGQESAGIAATDGSEIRIRRNPGLVSQVFDESDIQSLPGIAAVGHTRYSTAGTAGAENAGPVLVDTELGPIAVSHNGGITNQELLRAELERQGEVFTTQTDAEVVARVIARSPGVDMAAKIRNAMSRMVGAYSLTVLTGNELYAVRDPHGIRPLCIGTIAGGHVVASESCALLTISGHFQREVEPGEVIRINEQGVESLGVVERKRHALCLLELVYFARPDSKIMGQRIHLMRQNMGRQLAREAPVDADVVVGLPDSATPAAIGYAAESGIPYSEALIKNRYIGRTFIQPQQSQRQQSVRLKFNVLPEVVEGKRVVLIDDTIVRGTTSRPIVDLVRQAGAKEVHMRVHAPAIIWPCYLGVDLAKREDLIAARLTVPEIAEHIGVDSLQYLSLDGLMSAIGKGDNNFCHACMSGIYPVKTFSELDELATIESAS